MKKHPIFAAASPGLLPVCDGVSPTNEVCGRMTAEPTLSLLLNGQALPRVRGYEAHSGCATGEEEDPQRGQDVGGANHGGELI